MLLRPLISAVALAAVLATPASAGGLDEPVVTPTQIEQATTGPFNGRGHGLIAPIALLILTKIAVR